LFWISTCPYCNGVRIESIPILDEEICKFSYHPKSGVTLEFTRAATEAIEEEGNHARREMMLK
jgi:hypothetical protein